MLFSHFKKWAGHKIDVFIVLILDSQLFARHIPGRLVINLYRDILFFIKNITCAV